MDDQGQLPPDAKRLHEALANLIGEAEDVSRRLRVGRKLIIEGERPTSDAFSLLPRYSVPSVAEVLLGPQWPRIIRSLRKSVEAFSRHWTEAGAALYSLSAASVSRLDAMDAPGWRDRLRRALDKLLEWPFLKKACQFVPPEVGILVGVLEICDPPDWQAPLQYLAKTMSDLYALRGIHAAIDDEQYSAIETLNQVPGDATHTDNLSPGSVADNEAAANCSQAAGFAIDSQPPKKPKRSTAKGEGRDKLIAALTKHHKYADGGCLNQEPCGNNELARLAGVSSSTAKHFFDKEFGGHAKYVVLCRDAGRLADSLKFLNGEFSLYDLYGRRPACEDDSHEEGDE